MSHHLHITGPNLPLRLSRSAHPVHLDPDNPTIFVDRTLIFTYIKASDEGLMIMDTLLFPFRDFFSRFALTCATIKSIIFRMFALHNTKSPVKIFYKEFRNNHSFVKHKNNRHAICL